MADRDSPAPEESGSIPIAASSAAAETKQSPRSFLNSARRNLSEEELKAPGAIRLLISEIERLDDLCAESQAISKAYNDLRVDHGVLEARSKASRWNEILSGLCLAIGSFGIATGQRLLAVDGAHEIGISVMIVAAILVVAGIASKVLK